MNRRIFLFGASSAALFSLSRLHAQTSRGNDTPKIDNPYAEVEWDKCVYVQSMSHQHTALNDEEMQVFPDMGYQHLAFSNYYPSAPAYPLSAAFTAKNPDAIGCPNAEHHSFTDNGAHCNGLGSLLATGYGSALTRDQLSASPLTGHFENLNVFQDGINPGKGVYRLDITTKTTASGASSAMLSIEGAIECDFRNGFAAKGEVRERPIVAGKSQPLYLRATSATITTTLNYDKARMSVTQFRLMQGTNRPWREVFRAALDGEVVEGKRLGGLQYADGGGITLNHPTQTQEIYTEMLDFDPRVLGIEVWNVQTTGFGAPKNFYDKGPGPHLHYYWLWDDILKTGRRCLGFFVKDHLPFGRGRNVLLLPDLSSLSPTERERAALRAYRNGAFFGLIAAPASDGEKVVAPFDHSDFRFSRITVRRDANNQPQAIEVSVTGNDTVKRPNIQIRFVTENGVEHTIDAPQGEFLLKAQVAGRAPRKFVRVEAFAYPKTHNNGETLKKEAFGVLNVYDISLLHDKRATTKPTFFGNEQELPARIPIVDMIFSQPLRIL